MKFSARKCSTSKSCFRLTSSTPTTICQWSQYSYNNLAVYRSITCTARAGGSPQPPSQWRAPPWLFCPREAEAEIPAPDLAAARTARPSSVAPGPPAPPAHGGQPTLWVVSRSAVDLRGCGKSSLLKQTQPQPVPRTIIL